MLTAWDASYVTIIRFDVSFNTSWPCVHLSSQGNIRPEKHKLKSNTQQPVYVQHFKCNIRDIRSGYPHLHKWMRTLYWTVPAFKDTTQFEHIKWHYTRSHTQINPLSITPVGPLPDILPLDEEVPAVKAAVGN